MDFQPFVRSHLPPLLLEREPEIVAEIAEHLAALYDEARAAGVPHDEAVARAQAALPAYSAGFARDLQTAVEAPPMRAAHQWHRAAEASAHAGARGPALLLDLGGDLRQALRAWRQAPALAAGIVVTLALAIGGNTVIFSAIDALLLRPVLADHPQHLVHVFAETVDGSTRFGGSSYPDYVDLRDGAGVDGLAAFAGITLALDRGGATVALPGQVVSGNYFDVLGVRPSVGRAFLPDEDRPSAPEPVVVLSHGAWQRHFGGDPQLIGQPILLNGQSFTVVGIAPRGFTGATIEQAPDAWIPLAMQPAVRPPSAGLRRTLGGTDLLSQRSVTWLNVVGRLRADTPATTVAANMEVIARRLEADYPDSNRGRRFTLTALGEAPGVRTQARPLLRLLAAAVALVLLIACANVAGLLLVRALARRKDVAIRLALGASRWRLVRQWLAESLLLAVAGAAAGLVLAWWATPALYDFGIPDTIDLSINPRVLLFTLAIAVASALVFGCASALQWLRRDTIRALNEEGRGGTAGRHATRWRSGFVVFQVAVTLVLLIAAGLFLRTLQNAYAVDLGYHIDRTLLTGVNLDLRGYTPDAGQRAYGELLTRLRAIPGVEAASAARIVVLSGGARTTRVSTDGTRIEPNDPHAITVRANVVSHGYVATLGVPLLRGRDFSHADAAGAPPVAIVSRALADRVWPGADPIGKTLVGTTASYEVIGVVADMVYLTPVEQEAPGFYLLPLAQNYESAVTLHVRTVGDPFDVFPAVRQALREIDPLLALSTPRRLRAVLEETLGEQRMMARLVGAFGVTALVLAALGLYGMLAQLVTQRRTELGVRLALGATPGALFRLVLRQGVRLVLIGMPIGIAGALAASRYLRSELFGVEPTDPLTLAGVCAIFLAITAIACVVPARRAVTTDPTTAIRQA